MSFREWVSSSYNGLELSESSCGNLPFLDIGDFPLLQLGSLGVF